MDLWWPHPPLNGYVRCQFRVRLRPPDYPPRTAAISYSLSPPNEQPFVVLPTTMLSFSTVSKIIISPSFSNRATSLLCQSNLQLSTSCPLPKYFFSSSTLIASSDKLTSYLLPTASNCSIPESTKYLWTILEGRMYSYSRARWQHCILISFNNLPICADDNPYSSMAFWSNAIFRNGSRHGLPQCVYGRGVATLPLVSGGLFNGCMSTSLSNFPMTKCRSTRFCKRLGIGGGKEKSA